MAKLVVLKRKNWKSKISSKLKNTKNQLLEKCLPIFTKVFSSLRFRKKQEKREDPNPNPNPNPSYTTVTITLPEELVEEILHRLPVKSLVRFKSASRKWKSLIESSRFVEKHLRRRQKIYGSEEMKIVFEGSRTIRGLFHVRRTGLRVPGSCNGLVCVYDLVYVYLINPMTNVTRKLTPPRGNRVNFGTKISVGFGRDIVTGTYKVAVLYSFFEDHDDDDDDERVDTMVFDLGTNEWRWRYKTAGPMPLPCDLIRPERNSVFVKGSIFWLLARHQILVMDLHTEKFRTISQPRDIISSDGRIFMWSMEDRLCVSDLRRGSDIYVWVLVEEDNGEEKWEKNSFVPGVVPPLMLNSAWYSQSLVSPYQ